MIKLSLPTVALGVLTIAIGFGTRVAHAQAPAHPNPHAEFDRFLVENRRDVRSSPRR